MKTIITIFILSVTFIACGGYTSGTIQKTEKGFLKFTGKVEGTMISINEGTQFSYDPMVELYEVKPGNHTVKVYRNNQVVVGRDIYVGNQSTFEIEVP